ncbi:uncharacterized protein TrAFT101_003998 [Trichoderma asperellum]|uniref:Uncharacterized protein n=1 Tax=Trichoderma asperellum (strain ATCC 204424 / CBS 433.97 / NBRC 101777) TaxID=1042311 RepID=A0A2T3ZP08_TRIA4|nr:hypothetical protein M441DRAFT_53281 [Trichoderma asperellum CBS 433.97]PTB46551.1 hypothetical protein M441DRAFT_53281 [Trichoderma asperellum CBS 433.97]UKZ88236.1 hypothetical protein TrAFT101_003998 [Trichoderma asperellum]
MNLARFFLVDIANQQRDLMGYLWRLGLMNRKQCLSESFVGVPGSFARHAGSDEPRTGETPVMGSTETPVWPVPASKASTNGPNQISLLTWAARSGRLMSRRPIPYLAAYHTGAVPASVALEEFLNGACMDACGAGNEAPEQALPGDGFSIPSLFICSEAFM